jgi:WD40 repeat protein
LNRVIVATWCKKFYVTYGASLARAMLLLFISYSSLTETTRAMDKQETAPQLLTLKESALRALLKGKSFPQGSLPTDLEEEIKDTLIQQYDELLLAIFPPKAFVGHTGFIFSLAFSPDSRLLITGSGCLVTGPESPMVRIWDIDAKGIRIEQPLKQFIANKTDVYKMVLSPDGSMLAVSSCISEVRILNIKTGETIRELECSDGNISLGFSPDSTLLAIGSSMGSVIIVNIKSGEITQQFECIRSDTDASINLIAFSPDCNYLATGSWDGTAWLWHIKTEQPVQQFKGHTKFITSLAFSSDGNFLATGSADRTAKVWDVKTGKLIQSLSGHPDNVVLVVFSPDGNYLATAIVRYHATPTDYRARLWSIKTGQLIKEFIGHTDHVSSVAFSPHGKYLATGSDDRTALLWDLKPYEDLTWKQVVLIIKLGVYGTALLDDPQWHTCFKEIPSEKQLKIQDYYTKWPQANAPIAKQ